MPETTRDDDAAGSSDLVVDLQEVQRHYHMGDNVVRALDGVSLRVDSGSYFVLLGPSGGGKTTLLRLIGGLVRPGPHAAAAAPFDHGQSDGHDISGADDQPESCLPRRRADYRGTEAT